MPQPARGGAGDHLPGSLLWVCGACTVAATVLSILSIYLQLKNYRKPALQRCVVRIMVMVPLYACSSFIALFSLNAAFFIDAIRDLYEAFVIYAFLQLLITYLGGERDLLLRLRGRPPIPHAFPVSIFLSPMDPSDPWTLLNLKRGVLQYVQVKPILVLVTAICKATGTYREGNFSSTSGYTYVTVAYNVSICLSLYCLAMFWIAVNKDLKPFRPVPKFLCVKGILFFSFWQSVGVSLLVSMGIITQVGPYTDPEHMSLAIVDSMICLEMPFFAIAHQYAFKASDYIDPTVIHAARLPFLYAFRDAFGIKDVWEDIKYTYRARGVSYKAYEAADGGIHSETARFKRIRAGLRYSKGGKAKYWVSVPGQVDARRPSAERDRDRERESLLPRSNGGPSRSRSSHRKYLGNDSSGSDSDVSDATSLDFSDLSDSEEQMYDRARRIGYTGYPNVDVSGEQARQRRWEAEERILRGGRSRVNLPFGTERRSQRNIRKGKRAVYGAWGERPPSGTYDHGVTPADVDDAAFDGENENPGAWRAGDNVNGGPSPVDGTSLKWTKKRLAAAYLEVASAAPSPAASRTTFALEDEPEEEEQGDLTEGRADAVDLVSPAHLEADLAPRTNSQRNLGNLGADVARSRAGSRSSKSYPSPQPSPRVRTNSRLAPVQAQPEPQPQSQPRPAQVVDASHRRSSPVPKIQPAPGPKPKPSQVPTTPMPRPAPEPARVPPKAAPRPAAAPAPAPAPTPAPPAPAPAPAQSPTLAPAPARAPTRTPTPPRSPSPPTQAPEPYVPAWGEPESAVPSSFRAASFRIPSYAKYASPEDNPWQ